MLSLVPATAGIQWTVAPDAQEGGSRKRVPRYEAQGTILRVLLSRSSQGCG